MNKVNLLFFANFKELLNCGEMMHEFEAPCCVSDICVQLAKKGPAWEAIFAHSKSTVKIAINQQMAELSSEVKNADELAFFPPVTGG